MKQGRRRWDGKWTALFAGVGVATILGVCGCGRGVFLQDDGFSARTTGECETEEQCVQLLEEARRRVAVCEPNTIGKLRCDEARADESAVERMVERFTERDAERQRREEEQREQEAARREEQARKEEAQLQALEEQNAAEKIEEARLAIYRSMSLDLRIKRLVRCREDGAEQRADLGLNRACDSLLVDLLAVAESDEEKTHLVKANEDAIEAVRAAAEKEREREERENHRQGYSSDPSSSGSHSSGTVGSGGSGRLMCCDGTLSPSCTCGGSRRGCCSHHGGVCGCD